MSSFSFLINGNTLFFEGALTENIEPNFFKRLLEKPEFENIKSLDFSNVISGNSIGIRNLHLFFKGIETEIQLLNVPLWLMEQFGMIKSLLSENLKISSVVLPFYNPQTDEEAELVCIVGKDIPILASYENFEMNEKIINGISYVPDFDVVSAFIALETNSNRGIKVT